MFRNLSKRLIQLQPNPFKSKLSTISSTNLDQKAFQKSFDYTKLTSKLLAEGNGGKKIVGYWLAGTSAAVFGIIVFGGLTRLTESGLSMVDWKLVHFSAPKNDQEWQCYFDKYKEFPEYKINNADMTLSQFKNIYYMEHYHRVYGRLLGLTIIVPSILFSINNWVSPRNKKFLAASSALVVCQGLLGWFMVKSGLKSEIVENQEVPRVSSYRLAAHLGSAFVLYGLLINTAINILSPIKSKTILSPLTPALLQSIKKFKSKAHGVAALTFFTALSGAFVAGLDAGLIYNEFPTMGGGTRFIPSDIWDDKLGLRNPFENPTCAQFNHRILAISTVTGISALWYQSRKLGMMLPRSIRLLSNSLMFMAWTQGTLGVLTLLNNVPIPLASAHQAGSVTLLTFALWLVNRLKYFK